MKILLSIRFTDGETGLGFEASQVKTKAAFSLARRNRCLRKQRGGWIWEKEDKTCGWRSEGRVVKSEPKEEGRRQIMPFLGNARTWLPCHCLLFPAFEANFNSTTMSLISCRPSTSQFQHPESNSIFSFLNFIAQAQVPFYLRLSSLYDTM